MKPTFVMLIRVVWALASLAFAVLMVLSFTVDPAGPGADRVTLVATVGAGFVALALAPTAFEAYFRTRGLATIPAADLRDLETDIALRVTHRENTELLHLLDFQAGDDPRRKMIALRYRRETLPTPAAARQPASLLAEFDTADPHRLVLLGEPGSGKTVATIDLITELLARRRDDDPAPVPVRFALTGMTTGLSLPTWLAAELQAQFRLSAPMAAALIAQRRILPILDGLDEMDPGDETHRANAAIAAINSYLDHHTPGALILTCRTARYHALDRPVANATELTISPLTSADIHTYIWRRLDENSADSWTQLLGILEREALAESAGAPLTAMLSTPWRLMLTLTVCNESANSPHDVFFDDGAPSEPGARPVLRPAAQVQHRLLSGFTAAVVHRYDRSRERDIAAAPVTDWIQNSPRRRHYDEADVERWLRLIALLAAGERNSVHGGDIDLRTWWRRADTRLRRRPAATDQRPGRVRILHGALAAVLVLGGIAGCLTHLGAPYRVDWRDIGTYLGSFTGFETSFQVALVVVLVGVVAVPVLAARRAATASLHPSRLGLAGVRTWRGLRSLLSGLVLGATAGLGAGVALTITGSFAIRAQLELVLGAGTGAILGLLFSAVFALDRGTVDSVSPVEIIRDDLVYGLVCGLLVGCVGLVGGTLAVGLSFGLAISAALGVTFGMVLAPISGIRYLLAVVVLRISCGTPLRLARFLAWADASGLLRVAGVTYQFRHRELQQWLVANPVVAPKAPPN